MTDPKPLTAAEIARYKALDGQSVVLTDHQLVEDVDGAPAGVSSTSWEPAMFVVPWGRHGFPSRAEVYGPEDAA
jgi:hypothetical protein